MAFEDFDWEKLLSRIAAGTCTPFIGAGACADYLPSGAALAEAFAEEHDYPFPEGGRDLSRVTQFMAVDHRDAQFPKNAMTRFFDLSPMTGAASTFRFQREQFQLKKPSGRLNGLIVDRKIPRFAEESGIHSVLADINSTLYLTTNYDDYMRRALVARGRNALSDFCRWTPQLFNTLSSPFDNGYIPSESKPLVYHLHGHASNAKSLVVTEDDYLDYTAYIAQDLARSKEGKGKKVMLPGFIRTAMTDHLLLFVGYRVRDENLRVVLRTLWQTLSPSSDQLNLAVQLSMEPGNTSAEVERMRVYLEKHYEISLRLHVYWGDAREFARELRKRLPASPGWANP
jgi:hypothetical protein